MDGSYLHYVRLICVKCSAELGYMESLSEPIWYKSGEQPNINSIEYRQKNLQFLCSNCFNKADNPGNLNLDEISW